MSRISRKLLTFTVLTPLLFGFDFASKEAARTHLADGQVMDVWGNWLGFVLAENPGAMFSTPVPLPVIAIAGVLGIGLVVRMLKDMPSERRLPAAAAALIVSGALGNLLDRVGDGTVTDFIRISVQDSPLAPWLHAQLGTATWPIFNLADVWLLVGVGVMLWVGDGTRGTTETPSSTLPTPP